MMRILIVFFVSLLLTGCVSPYDLGISQEQWRSMSPEQQADALSGYEKVKKMQQTRLAARENRSTLSVYVLSGKALMPPFDRYYSIETMQFSIVPGVCQFVELKSIDTNKHVSLQVCYDGRRLSLDASRYETDKVTGSVYFDYNPIWVKGFTYSNVNSTGYVRLRDASISIKAIPHYVANDDDKNFSF